MMLPLEESGMEQLTRQERNTCLLERLAAGDTAAEVPYLFARKIADDLNIARYRETFLR